MSTRPDLQCVACGTLLPTNDDCKCKLNKDLRQRLDSEVVDAFRTLTESRIGLSRTRWDVIERAFEAIQRIKIVKTPTPTPSSRRRGSSPSKIKNEDVA